MEERKSKRWDDGGGTFKSPFFTTAVKRRYLAAMMRLFQL